MKGRILFFLLLGFQFCSDHKVQKKFYSNGNLLSTVTLDKLGRKNGIEVEFFENGDTSVFRTWSGGVRNGKSAVYYRSGNIEQVNFFKNGIRCCEASFYDEKGFLKEIQYLNDKGNIIDYKKFDKMGKRLLDHSSSLALAIPKKDTVELGEYYEAEIRLGNKRWGDSIRVVIGNWEVNQLLDAPNLPSIDSVTSFLRVKAEYEGTNTIKGTIIEVNTIHIDSAVIKPFRISFFVKKREINL